MFSGTISNRLLLDEPPLVILPKFASLVGLNEAVILQQVHYWIQINGKEHDGRLWTYNSIEEWRKQFPFWSTNTITRMFKKLRKKTKDRGPLLLTANYNKLPMDKTLWYSIDYEELEGYIKQKSPFNQNGLMVHPKWVNHSLKMGEPIPETNTEINTENGERRDVEFEIDAIQDDDESSSSDSSSSFGSNGKDLSFEKSSKDLIQTVANCTNLGTKSTKVLKAAAVIESENLGDELTIEEWVKRSWPSERPSNAKRLRPWPSQLVDGLRRKLEDDSWQERKRQRVREQAGLKPGERLIGHT
jgi:hypothetical protein